MVTSQLLLSFLAFSTPASAAWGSEWIAPGQAPLLPFIPPAESSAGSLDSAPRLDVSTPQEHRFTLRHVFHRGTTLYPNLHRRLDVNPAKVRTAAAMDQEGALDGVGLFKAQASSITIQRLQDRSMESVQPLLDTARLHGGPLPLPPSAWSTDEIPSPNVTDKGTVVNFALMAASAYNHDKTDSEWEDTSPPFNLSSDVGWERDGIRGHVFSDDTNSTIVIAIKGTTSAVFDGAETTTNDKENDNLFASCCCGQGGNYLWRQVCDCMTSAYTCNDTCVTKAIRKPNRYYHASLELYGNITEMYPDANVWVTGHSLGGLVSTLLGLTFGLPVVTFESVPQALAAGRLGLPAPPGYSSATEARNDIGIYNFGHTADPVYMGACNGGSSLCTIAGYAMESQCHVGQRCVYDVVHDRSWRMSLTTHGIRACIRDVYKDYETVPSCVADDECVDCFNWKRYESNRTESSSTSIASSTFTTSTTTRTETCKTPGWWGCRDETSTTTSSIPSTTSTTTSAITITTETCKSYGWFGNCLDPITTTSTSVTTIPPRTTTSQETSPTSTSCTSPGLFFGCKDPTKSTSSIPHATCSTPGFFFGCKDKVTSAAQHAITAAPVFPELGTL